MLLLTSAALAQQTCYEKVRNDGLRLLERQRYGEAINQFWAAWISCDDKPAGHDLESLIRQAINGWVVDLESRIATERATRLELEQREQQLQQTNQQLAEARNRAEANARLALEQGRKAEALRLTMLSESARLRGEKTDALLLASLALRLSGEDKSPVMWRTLGLAAYEALGSQVFSNYGPAYRARLLSEHSDRWLVETNEKALYQLDVSAGDPSVIRLAGPQQASGWVASPGGNAVLYWAGNSATLVQANGAQPRTLSGHTAPIRFGAFSPDGSKIITGGRDHIAQLWDARSGNLLALLKGHTGPVYEALFDAQAQHILTRSGDGSARLWAANGELLASLNGGATYVHDLLFLPNGSGIVTAGADGQLRHWDMHGRLIDSLTCSPSPLLSLEYWPAAERLVLRSAEGQCSLVAFPLARAQTLLAPQSLTLGFNVGAQQLVTWHSDQHLRMWSANGDEILALGGHSAPIVAAQFSNDGRWLLSTDQQGNSRLWSTQGQLFLDWPTGGEARFSSNQQQIISSEAESGALRLFPLPPTAQQNLEADAPAQREAINRLATQYGLLFIRGGGD
jgi:WD40 repeat protein